ncbi:hypothetical protein M501DRAFT_1028955 [Patellaria atrata CBS 101060]|uniref:Uncharacterized protein n=1 Tax=Patellaria atrata CBS 101060 TaxID=1346257 RepID=A0A9P4SGQ5_9PEZI|nr:hypothetical protein M501DRAFT_1028955 [Patellaria atrata CBS 101060]
MEDLSYPQPPPTQQLWFSNLKSPSLMLSESIMRISSALLALNVPFIGTMLIVISGLKSRWTRVTRTGSKIPFPYTSTSSFGIGTLPSLTNTKESFWTTFGCTRSVRRWIFNSRYLRPCSEIGSIPGPPFQFQEARPTRNRTGRIPVRPRSAKGKIRNSLCPFGAYALSRSTRGAQLPTPLVEKLTVDLAGPHDVEYMTTIPC